jgi:hypothetical protein
MMIHNVRLPFLVLGMRRIRLVGGPFGWGGWGWGSYQVPGTPNDDGSTTEEMM